MDGLIFIDPQGKPAVGYAMLQQDKFGLEISFTRKKKRCFQFCQDWAWTNEGCSSGVPETHVETKSVYGSLRSQPKALELKPNWEGKRKSIFIEYLLCFPVRMTQTLTSQAYKPRPSTLQLYNLTMYLILQSIIKFL